MAREAARAGAGEGQADAAAQAHRECEREIGEGEREEMEVPGVYFAYARRHMACHVGARSSHDTFGTSDKSFYVSEDPGI